VGFNVTIFACNVWTSGPQFKYKFGEWLSVMRTLVLSVSRDANPETTPQIRLRPLPSTSFPVYFALFYIA
jgi:hypothetical protein